MTDVAAARQIITVWSSEGKKAKTTKLPEVFLSPIRTDIVQRVHTNMNKNARQPYAVMPDAGMQHSAESWHPGRAVARVPRVHGSGTRRAGEGAFANMCRKGRMFAPTKTWRRWHRMSNVTERRYAVASALAASALPSLVMARGHRIESVPEVPLVVSDSAESITKTKEAVKFLTALGASGDADHARDSRKIRPGSGKARNRRYVQRRGPLIVYKDDKGITRAFRNLPGVDVAHVDSLSLLSLAPGGHLGRFIIWTESAFRSLPSLFGSLRREAQGKKGFFLPRSKVTNSDISRIILSDEIQSQLRLPKTQQRHVTVKKNPLRNFGAMAKLNPHHVIVRRQARLVDARARLARRLKRTEAKRTGTTATATAAAAKKEPAKKEPTKKPAATATAASATATAGAKKDAKKPLSVRAIRRKQKRTIFSDYIRS
jgi:large subunit ribosomal protein L4e